MCKELSTENAMFYSDLDGTLLNNDARLSFDSRKILNSILEQGLLLGVASARNLTTISSMLEGMPLSLPVISLNGGFISTIKTKTHLQVNNIDHTICNSLFSLSAEFKKGFLLSTTTDTLSDGILYSNVKNDGELWYLNDYLNCSGQTIAELNQGKLTENVKLMCFTFIDKIEILEQLRKRILQECSNMVEIHLFENQYSPTWYWLTVHSRYATKDRAISYVKQSLNLQDRKLVVFGDGINDIKMFKVADVSIAVENSSQEVRDAADIIIGPNESDSVAKYLQTLTESKQ